MKSTLTIGSYIRVKNHANIGQVVRISRRKVLVAIGTLFFDLPLQAVEIVEIVESSPTSVVIQKKNIKPNHFVKPTASAKMDPILDLHGFNSAQALFALDKFLDHALLLGYSSLSIIHGQGKGILRSAVRSYLHKHPLVKKVIEQSPIRCMAGITVVEL
ncbi:Smr/MutS family protein [Candidatus Cardinium hertigii]|jgi:DNA mismatch repair protein MutS2|nr:Smr/MutS family protein [Candidatus Cardinium hertigii]